MRPSPSNPFDQPQPAHPAATSPVLALVQGAVVAAAQHDDLAAVGELFAELTRRGIEAYREAALLLVQHILAWNGMSPDELGPDDAAEHPPNPRTPALNLMYATFWAYLRGQDSAAFSVLAAAPNEHVESATRYLFVVARFCGQPADDDRFVRWMTTLCPLIL